MLTFDEWLEENVNESWRDWLVGGALGIGSMMGGATQAQDKPAMVATKGKQVAPDIHMIDSQTYHVVGYGRASKIGGPNYGYEAAKKDAQAKLLKHLKMTNADMKVTVISVDRPQGKLAIKYEIKLSARQGTTPDAGKSLPDMKSTSPDAGKFLPDK